MVGHSQCQMENKWHVCRLTVNKSGKIRWCIGPEKTWTEKLKVLIYLPAILLALVLLYLLLKHISDGSKGTQIVDQVSILKKASDLTINMEYKGISVCISIYAGDRESEYLPCDGDKTNDSVSVKQFVNEELHLGTGFVKRIYRTILNNSPNRVWGKNLSPEDVRKYQGENMARYIDESTNPCDDFYQYACGNWSKYHPIPKDRSGFDTFELVRENIDYYLRELLEDIPNETHSATTDHLQDILNRMKDKIDQFELYVPPKQRNESYFKKILLGSDETATLDPLLKAKNMYRSCMDEEAISKRGIKPLLDLLSELRYWPVIQERWNERDFDLIWLLAQLRLYNNDILIGEWIAPDVNSDKYVVMIKQTSLGLPRKDYYLEEDSKIYLDAYHSFMVQILVILGARKTEAEKAAEEILNFETELAKITPNNDCQNYTMKSYTRCTLEEFQKLVPQIDFIKYFSIIMEGQTPSNTTVITYCLDYLKRLVILLEQTSARTITNYVLWRFVINRINNLDQRFNEAKERFHDILYGRQKLPSRWRICVSQTNSHLNIALGHLFVKKFFDDKSKNDTLIMTKAIQDSFKDILARSEWLEEETKRLAIDKIQSMQLKIGYPNLILDKELLTAQYHDVLINPDYYFENCLSLLQHTSRKEHSKLGKVVNKNVWSTAPTVVNAYYSRHKNQIIFPAAILQPPFYHQHFPRAINFGGIGMTIGHEISHAFDNRGRLFDNEGKMRWWWTKNDTEKFEEISQCLIDQYNSFTLPELNINLDGTLTQTENIADNSAIKQSFNAYSTWLQDNEDFQMPYVKVTSIQLFFVSFAQMWCGNNRPEAIKNRMKVSVHPPGRFRVLGTLRNFPEFAKVFECKKGTPMNPINKCKIW